MSERYLDRADAGRRLAVELAEYGRRADVVVLALPRGGVAVAYEVATALEAPLDVLVVRKLGVPGQEELAMGAIADGEVLVRNDDVVQALHIPTGLIWRTAEREAVELTRRQGLYRGGRPPLELAGRTILIIDDGLATGSTMRAAVRAVRMRSPRKIVVAVPVGTVATCAELAQEADSCVCPQMPEHLQAVGFWYANFSQLSDAEVRHLLELAERRGSPPRVHDPPAASHHFPLPTKGAIP
jgi:predicted phosphoribosyltransferase